MYAEANDGEVFHYRDSYDLKADAPLSTFTMGVGEQFKPSWIPGKSK